VADRALTKSLRMVDGALTINHDSEGIKDLRQALPISYDRLRRGTCTRASNHDSKGITSFLSASETKLNPKP
jgi:hypothetical protein